MKCLCGLCNNIIIKQDGQEDVGKALQKEVREKVLSCLGNGSVEGKMRK